MERRNKFIDELRGIAVIIMVIFHFIYQENLWTNSWGDILDDKWLNLCKLSAQILFIFIAGICSNFSRDNIKRGILYIYIGLLINFITYLVTPDNIITFGILSFMGVSILVYEIFKDQLNKINVKVGMGVFVVLFILFYFVVNQSIFKDAIKSNSAINGLVKSGYLNIIGLKSESFKSSDFFPIVPWIFIFMAGALEGIKVKEEKAFCNKNTYDCLSFIGRKSLIIYLIHIPILLIIIKVIN